MAVDETAILKLTHFVGLGIAFSFICEFDPEPRLHDPNQLVIWTIEDAFDERRFRA
jgi:hypothetical protein